MVGATKFMVSVNGMVAEMQPVLLVTIKLKLYAPAPLEGIRLTLIGEAKRAVLLTALKDGRGRRAGSDSHTEWASLLLRSIGYAKGCRCCTNGCYCA